MCNKSSCPAFEAKLVAHLRHFVPILSIGQHVSRAAILSIISQKLHAAEMKIFAICCWLVVVPESGHVLRVGAQVQDVVLPAMSVY